MTSSKAQAPTKSFRALLQPFAGIARRLLKFLPDSTVVPILQGELKGYKWLLHSGVGSYWLGTYEPEEEKLFTSMIKPGMICYDC
jgi:hypothetical protein